MRQSVAFAIPSIPPRADKLARAIKSISRQDHPIEAICVAVDTDHDGAWTTRNRAIAMALAADTEWIGFLDDDDTLLPRHVSSLVAAALEGDVSMAWGWFEVVDGGSDPWPQNRGRQFDPENYHVVPITYIVKSRVLAKAMEQTKFLPDEIGAWQNQDQPLFEALHRIGGSVAIDDITWRWGHHGANTSGLPSRWI